MSKKGQVRKLLGEIDDLKRRTQQEPKQALTDQLRIPGDIVPGFYDEQQVQNIINHRAGLVDVFHNAFDPILYQFRDFDECKLLIQFTVHLRKKNVLRDDDAFKTALNELGAQLGKVHQKTKQTFAALPGWLKETQLQESLEAATQQFAEYDKSIQQAMAGDKGAALLTIANGSYPKLEDLANTIAKSINIGGWNGINATREAVGKRAYELSLLPDYRPGQRGYAINIGKQIIGEIEAAIKDKPRPELDAQLSWLRGWTDGELGREIRRAIDDQKRILQH